MHYHPGLVLDGRYTFQRRLGAGGFGEVWLAIDGKDQQHVAVKLLRHHEPDHLDRFIREATNLWRLVDQPSVIRIFDHQLHSSSPYIVMEYCAGGSLHAFADRPNPWREVAAMLCHLANGLAVVHQRGGFHRDLKPDNLLLPEFGASWNRVKIGDFGIARVPASSSNTVTRHPAGTEGYMAPELFRGENMSTACDVYSLGVTALELLSGRRAIEALDTTSMPTELRDLVRAMLDTDPARRPSMTTIMERCRSVLMPPSPVHPLLVTAATPRRSGGFFDFLVGIAGTALVSAGAVMAIQAVANSGNEYDPSVERYRGPDGRFRRGRR